MIQFYLKMNHDIDPSVDAGIKPSEEGEEEY